MAPLTLGIPLSEDALVSSYFQTDAQLLARDMARLDDMFARHACRHVYLDVGTNVGVQIRKVLEPAQYPITHSRLQSRSSNGAAQYVRKVMASHFGHSSPRCNVCAVGIEPNPNHAARLRAMEGNLSAAGFGVVIFRLAAAYAQSTAVLDQMDADPSNEYWDASVRPAASTEMTGAGAGVRVRTIDLARLVRELDLRLRRVAADASTRGQLVMKIDIEGSEYAALLQMIETEILCAVDDIFIEWHTSTAPVRGWGKRPMGIGEGRDTQSRNPRWTPSVEQRNQSARGMIQSGLRAAIGVAVARARQEPGCRTGLLHVEDDETYLHDLVPYPAASCSVSGAKVAATKPNS